MDFDSSNYNTDELLNILEINQSGDYSLDNIFKLTKKSMDTTTSSDDNANKEALLHFLTSSFKRLGQHFQYDVPDYMGMELDRLKIKLLTNNNIINNDPSKFVINHKISGSGLYDDNQNSGGRAGRTVEKRKFKGVNPIKREIYNTVLTINTKYRNNYYGSKSTDFLVDLSNPVKNVTGLKISNAELQNTYYTISNYLKTNVFYVHITTGGRTDGGGNAIAMGKYKIEIPDGNYTSSDIVNSINGTGGFGLKKAKLYSNLLDEKDLTNIISVIYDSMTKKIIFSLKPNLTPIKDYAFDLDFVLHGEVDRDIEKNLGWLLGYRKHYYSFDEKTVDGVEYLASYKSTELNTLKGVSVTIPGFQPEGPADFTGTKFFLIEVNDFNNNSIQSFYYPGTFNSLNMKDLLGKIPNNVGATILFEDSYGPINPTRYYLGPVNIQKLHIRLLDENGIVVDLNNVDFALTFELEVLHVHYEMLDQ